jgi:hypothetical protein
MGDWGFSLERLLDVWNLLYEPNLRKYSVGMYGIYHS